MSENHLVPRNDYSNEPMLVATQAWRDDLDAWLSAERGRRAALAKKLGINAATLSQLKDGGIKKSEMILPICRATGIDPPEGYVSSQSVDELEALRTENPEGYAHVMSLIRMLRRSGETPK